MTNIFSGIITESIKDLYTNAISALLYDDSMTIPCRLHYGVTKYENCTNCQYDPIGQKSANRAISGAQIPFPNGTICPMCNGVYKKAVIATEDIYLVVVFDYKKFTNVGTVLSDPQNTIQVMTFMTNGAKLLKAKTLSVAIDVKANIETEYKRISPLDPIGFGRSDFCLSLWERT